MASLSPPVRYKVFEMRGMWKWWVRYSGKQGKVCGFIDYGEERDRETALQKAHASALLVAGANSVLVTGEVQALT